MYTMLYIKYTLMKTKYTLKQTVLIENVLIFTFKVYVHISRTSIVPLKQQFQTSCRVLKCTVIDSGIY